MSDIITQQILIPKKVYIGDAAELRISFNSSDEITSFSFDGGLDYSVYTIENTSLNKSGLNYYQISINFVPWRTGDIKFPNLILETLQNNETQESQVIENIKVDPISIVSLVEQNQITSLRGAKNPMLLPGTSYKLWGTLIFFVVLLIVIIRILVKHKQIALFIKNKKLEKKYKKNKKKTLKALQRLLKNPKNKTENISDKEFAKAIQNLMRCYLETRFEFPFTRSAASEMYSDFIKATSDLASDEKLDAMEKVSGIFLRTDYIRYGSRNFEESEKKEIIETLCNCIGTLEYIPPKITGFEAVEKIQGGKNV